MKISLPCETGVDFALLSWIPQSDYWEANCGTAGKTPLITSCIMALHSQGFGCVNLFWNVIPLSADQTKLSVWTLSGHLLSKPSVKERSTEFRSCFWGVFRFHLVPLPLPHLYHPNIEPSEVFSERDLLVENAKSVWIYIFHNLKGLNSAMCWTVINLKVSHLVLLHADLRGVSMTRNSYCYSSHLLTTEDVRDPE